jgi:hypothetical protein
MAEKEPLIDQLMPIFLGLITDSALEYVSDLNMAERTLAIIVMGVIYSVLHYVKKKRAGKCAKCGFMNPPDSKFCSKCGAEL